MEAERSCGLFQLHSPLIARVFPPVRVLLGLQVSTFVRDCLRAHSDEVVYCASPSFDALTLTELFFRKSLGKFQHPGIKADVAVCDVPLLTRHLLNEKSWPVKHITRFELAHCNITFKHLDGLYQFLMACSRLTQLKLSGDQLKGKGRNLQLGMAVREKPLTLVDIESNDSVFEAEAGLLRALEDCNHSSLTSLRLVNALQSGRILSRILEMSSGSLTCLDLSSSLDAGELSRIAAPLATCSRLTQLKLSECDIADETLEAMGDVFANIPCISDLDLSENDLSPNGVQSLSRCLAAAGNTSLRSLNLAGNSHAFQERGAAHTVDFGTLSSVLQACSRFNTLRLAMIIFPADAALQRLFSGLSGLTEVDAYSCNLCQENIEGFCEGLAASAPLLRKLIVARNARVGPAGAGVLCARLRSMSALEILEIDGCGVEDGGLAAIAAALPSMASLKQLRVGWNGAGEAGIGALAAALEGPSRLEVVDVSGNLGMSVDTQASPEGPRGATALARALQRGACPLASTSLDRCAVLSSGALAIAKALQSAHASTLTHVSFQWVGLRFNPGSRLESLLEPVVVVEEEARLPECCEAIGELLRRCPKLEFVGLAGNFLQAAGLERLFFPRGEGSQATGTCHVTHLVLDNNDLCDSGVEVLAEALPALQMLRRLSLRSNDVSRVGACSLAARLPTCLSMEVLLLGCNDIAMDGLRSLASTSRLLGRLRHVQVLEGNDCDVDARDVRAVFPEHISLE